MKKLIPKIIFVILIIVLAISIIIAIAGTKGSLTINMYNEICEKQNYTFSMTEENLNINYSLIVSKKENAMSIEAKSDNEHTTTLVEEDAAYYIMHSEKEYYLYDTQELDADIIKNGLAGIEDEQYIKGYEKINGKSYYYEEFNGVSTFIIWSKDTNDTDSIKTRFYFDKGKIVYIKTILENTEELLKIEFTDDVDENKFKIPDDYAEM